MRRRFSSFSFATKLMLSYIILVLLTASSIGIYAYQTTFHSRLDYTQTNMMNSLEQIRDNMRYQISDIDRISSQLFNDYSFQNLLLDDKTEYDTYRAVVDTLVPKLDATLKLSVNEMSLSLYVNNQGIYEIYDPNVLKDPTFSGPAFHILHSTRLIEEPWFQQWDLSEMKNIWMQVGTDEEFGNISLIRNIIHFDRFDNLGLIKITIKKNNLFKSVDSFNLSKAELFVFDENSDNVIYGNAKASSSSVLEGNLSESDMLEVTLPLTETGWILSAFIPYSELQKDAVRVRNVTLLVCFASFFVIALMGWLISRYFSKRFGKIITSMNTLQDGDFHKRISIRGNDEFSQIAEAFNNMAENIDHLIKEVYISGLQKKEAELEALQNQINPHFLYNTLSSINSLANLGEVDQLSEMITRLVKFYRLTLNKGKTIILLDEEIQQVQAYLDIQRIKYRDTLSVIYDVEEQVRSGYTVKLILQPFVENVIKHAWFGERIHIRIQARKMNEEIHIKIIDDGLGMDPEIIQNIKNHRFMSVGYGIRNVEERIQLQYGEQYGVSFFSHRGAGTTVLIRIPFIMEEH